MSLFCHIVLSSDRRLNLKWQKNNCQQLPFMFIGGIRVIDYITPQTLKIKPQQITTTLHYYINSTESLPPQMTMYNDDLMFNTGTLCSSLPQPTTHTHHTYPPHIPTTHTHNTYPPHIHIHHTYPPNIVNAYSVINIGFAKWLPKNCYQEISSHRPETIQEWIWVPAQHQLLYHYIYYIKVLLSIAMLY